MKGTTRRKPMWCGGGLALLAEMTGLAGRGVHQAAGAARPVAAIADKRPTKDAYIGRLARLCDARHRAVVSLGVPFSSPRDYARRGADKIRKLGVIELVQGEPVAALPDAQMAPAEQHQEPFEQRRLHQRISKTS